MEVIVQKNKERNHYPKRVSDAKWAEVKKDLKQKQYGTKQVDGKNQQLKQKKTPSPGPKKNAVAPSAEPPSEPKKPRRSTRNKGKK